LNQHHHEKGFIAGPSGRLQMLYQPGREGMPAVVVCHPHPQYGGTMRNKVVYWIGRAFEDAGCSVLRFNFRGVEESEGEWDDGIGEADDVTAALEWLHLQHPDSALWMAGFSFGCYAGLQAARKNERVERMFAVAPAVSLWSFDFMNGETRPLTIVSGTADEVVSFEAVHAWAAEQPEVQFHAIEGAGHFFAEHMTQMTEALLLDAGLSL